MRSITSNRMFPDSIVRITSEYYTYDIIRNICGEWEAEKWKAWMHSFDRRQYEEQARKLNWRSSRFGKPYYWLPITDMRTRGGRFMLASKAKWDAHYRELNPPPKEPQGSNALMSRIMGIKPV